MNFSARGWKPPAYMALLRAMYWQGLWRAALKAGTNLLVMEPFRGRGIGGALLEHMVAVAQAHGARMAVLEAQSCNTAAIRFYLRHGFSMIGFDLYAYSNQDPQRGEVRVEMGRMLADF